MGMLPSVMPMPMAPSGTPMLMPIGPFGGIMMHLPEPVIMHPSRSSSGSHSRHEQTPPAPPVIINYGPTMHASTGYSSNTTPTTITTTTSRCYLRLSISKQAY